MLEKELQNQPVNGRAINLPAIQLPGDRLERVPAWGGATSGISHVYRPTTTDQLRDIFHLAQQSGRNVGLRGGGNSYGDAALNDENILLDFRRMNRILEWNPETGIVTAEPGVTISQLWQYVLEDGWWPPVVTGTSATTLGGCAGMNVHGKNAYKQGTIGDHILHFDLMLPSGETITCSRDENSDIFHAAIGGFGMLGVFTTLTLQMKRVYSGLLNVQTEARPNLAAMFDYFHEFAADADYIVGWMDAFASGDALGRGDVHKAYYLPPDADPAPAQSLRLENQHVPDTMFGIVPKSIIWIFMRPFMNNLGTRLINTAKYYAGKFGSGSNYQQSHAAFHFLLDYVPNWKRSYGSGGLIQYQPFIPKENAQDAFGAILAHCQKQGLVNYLTVFKRHRPDDFLLTHGLDGFSMAMDFRITKGNKARVAQVAQELDEIVLAANGRFYFAKDSTLRPQVAQAYLGDAAISQFVTLKNRLDPNHRMQTNLWRRVFGDLV